MKHLKKLAALLLVGVLALSLLTACGGGGGSTSADAQAETAVMAAINQNRPVNSVKLQNSSELRKTANQEHRRCHQWKIGPAQFFDIQIPCSTRTRKTASVGLYISLPSVITKIRTSQNLSKPSPTSTATI